MKADGRPPIDNYFMHIAKDVSTRSTCIRGNVGALIVKDRQILASGYNGAPYGCEHCTEETCLRNKLKVPSGERHELCRGTHAEQNAIIQAAKHGININGATIYCTLQPCCVCAKLIINAGIKKVVYCGQYNEKIGLDLLKEAGVELIQFDKKEEKVMDVDYETVKKVLKDHESNHEIAWVELSIVFNDNKEIGWKVKRTADNRIPFKEYWNNEVEKVEVVGDSLHITAKSADRTRREHS